MSQKIRDANKLHDDLNLYLTAKQSVGEIISNHTSKIVKSKQRIAIIFSVLLGFTFVVLCYSKPDFLTNKPTFKNKDTTFKKIRLCKFSLVLAVVLLGILIFAAQNSTLIDTLFYGKCGTCY